MDLDALRSSPIGTLVPIRGFDPRHRREYDYFAFLPEPLPPDRPLAHNTWQVITSASQAIARLDQAGRQLPNPSLLRQPLLRREAVSTSALEGTHAAFTDVLEADVADDKPPSPEVREVLNYVRAAEHAFSAVKQGRSISLGLLSEVHAQLVQGTTSDGQDAGRVRSGQVVIGPDGCTVEEARFVPPPADERLDGGLREWESWVGTPAPLPSVARAALAHYQFETLHPFHDGNGRIGRLVVVLQFMEDGELHEPLLEVSPWFEARRRDYQSNLLEVSITGDFDGWIRFFAEGIGAQAVATVGRIDRLVDVHAEIRDRVRAAGLRGIAVQIAEDLIGRPYVRPAWAARNYDVTYPAANAAIRRLTEVGILQEVTGRSYARVFSAPTVVEALVT